MNVDEFLGEWCKKKGINSKKIPEKIWDETVGRIEDDIDEYIRDKSQEFVGEWAWMNIEQHLDEHPEWKEKSKEVKK